MPNVDYVGTVLEVLAGVSLLLGLVMAVSWGARRGSPGFGLWTISNLIVAACCLALAHDEHFYTSVVVVLVPSLMVFAATLRLEGLRRFRGRKRFDYRVLALPVVVLALMHYFWFVDRNDLARAALTAGSIALLFGAMAGVMIPRGRRDRDPFELLFGALFAVYGALLVGYAIFWSTSSHGLPLLHLSRANLAFAVLVILFEIAWVVILLTLGYWRETRILQAAGAAAESARQQLATMVDFLPDATFAIDIDRTVIGWNRAAEELTGVPAEQVLGKSYEEHGRPALTAYGETMLDIVLDPSREIPARYANARWEGDRLSAEIEPSFPANPNQGRHLWLTATVLRDRDGAVIGAVESLRDISSREQAERVIRQREQQFRSLFELNPDGILAIAPDGSIYDANPAACEMLGMTKEEICAAGPAGIIRWDSDSDERLPDRLLPGREMQEFRFVRKDKTTFPAECRSVAYCDTVGLPRAFVEFRDVSEQREDQRALRANEARLLEALAVAQVGNWEIDLAARSLWLSPEALRIHGIEGGPSYQPLDTTDASMYFEDPESVVTAMRKLAAEGGSFELEYEASRSHEEAPRRVRARGEAIRDENGVPVRIVGVMQDITELRQVEEALQLAQYSVDRVGDQIFWVRADGHIAYVSDSTCDQLGYAREELLGMTIFDVDPNAGADWDEAWKRAGQSGSYTHEAVHRTKDGRDIPVEVSTNHAFHNGEEHVFIFARDISRRKATEEGLRRTQVSVDRANDLVYWLNPEGRFVFVTDSTCRQLGYSREELLRKSIYDVDPTLSKDWQAGWESMKERGSLVHGAVHRTKDGRDIPVELSINYIRHDGQEYNLVFARDTSDRKRADDLLDLGHEKMRQGQTLEAIGQLAGGIAHDFNNLLTAIIGYGNLILANEEAQGLVSGEAEEIRAAAVRASALTHQILAFSRRQTLRPQVVTVNELVSGMRSRLQQVLGEDIDLVTQLPAAPSRVEIDVSQFEEVLTNLVANSRDAMPDGGRVVVEVRDVYLDEDYCRVYSDLEPGNYVLLSLADTGEGMSFETMDHVFEPFFTTKTPGSASGLGLSTVYGIVRQSGGYVNVYSEIGKGTTFKIYLPSVEGGPEPAAVGSRTVHLTSTAGSENVLVVEDEAPLRRLVARVLGSLGYKVFVAGSGPEALELLDDLERPPDLLLTDVVLPGGMLGNEVAAAFRRRIPDLAVLFVSGHARDAIVHSGHLDEGVEFLAKPFTPESLAAKVREVLDAHRREDPETHEL